MPDRTPDLLRVASYNIRKCVGLDRRRRPDRVLAVVRELDADVVVLQEADRRLGMRPTTLQHDEIEAETGLVPLSVAQNGASLGWHGNAILARPEVQVHRVDRLTLPGLEPRGAVIAQMSLGSDTITLAAVHLGLSRRHRRLQLRHIADHLDGGGPAVIAGDFNEWSTANGLEDLHGFDVHAPGRSYHSARPVAALDRIAASPGLAIMRSGVHRVGAARRASDHLPIWADIRLAGACNGTETGVDDPATVGV